jgi:hypothetical protein
MVAALLVKLNQVGSANMEIILGLMSVQPLALLYLMILDSMLVKMIILCQMMGKICLSLFIHSTLVVLIAMLKRVGNALVDQLEISQDHQILVQKFAEIHIDLKGKVSIIL